MGHAIGGGFLNAKTKDAAMKEGYADAVEFACHNVDRYENPDGSYYNSFKFYNRTFNTEEEAYRFFDNLGWYMDGVCMVKRTPDSVWKKYNNATRKIVAKKKALYDKVLENFKSRTSATVGCKKCGTRISNDVAIRNRLYCPNCGDWIAPNSAKQKLIELNNAFKVAEENLKTETAIKGKPSYWAKYEVHC